MEKVSDEMDQSPSTVLMNTGYRR
uniref:Uncharacterized protein n=1 Tax=Nelumbo nucifera TaxID=4432 RepID=A0A822YGY4_NELNU|nr:TPA_asm: hypothetical protein HUJ06_010244 [Nelumbo nucifera]